MVDLNLHLEESQQPMTDLIALIGLGFYQLKIM